MPQRTLGVMWRQSTRRIRADTGDGRAHDRVHIRRDSVGSDAARSPSSLPRGDAIAGPDGLVTVGAPDVDHGQPDGADGADEHPGGPAMRNDSAGWWARPREWAGVRLALWSTLTMVLAYESPTRLTRSIPGNPGDAYLVLSLLEWGADRSVHLFSGYWDGPMFTAGNDVMAYTDTFLPLVIPFGLIELVTGSRVLAFNLLFLASWVLCAEATYRLALRLTRNRTSATVAAAAFTFSTIRLSQTDHFQLAWAGFIPLTIVALLRMRESPTVLRGVVLGAVLVVQMLTSAYYGVVMIAFSGICVALMAIDSLRRRTIRHEGGAIVAFLVVLGGLMAPIAHWYASAQSGAPPRVDDPSVYALRLGDLRSPPPRSTLLRHIPFLDGDTIGRSSENYAYLGLFVLVFVPVLAIALAVRWERYHHLLTPPAAWIAIVSLGAVCGLVAFGPDPVLGVSLPFYDLAVRLVPGFDSVVALVRLMVFTELALVLLAAAGLMVLLRRIDQRRLRAVIGIVLLVVVVLEGLNEHQMLDVVEPRPGSVNAVLEDLDPGVVALLPMAPREVRPTSVYIEATRMALGSNDDLQSVNGYSGRAPNGYAESVYVINTFPAPEALDELARLGVDYVAIYTEPLATGMASVDELVADSGLSSFDPAEVERRLASVPPGLVARRIDATDGVVLVLADRMGADG